MKVSLTLRDVFRIATGWDPEEKVTSETAWLNGMRGLAAALVMMAHYSWDYLSFTSDAPFGALMLTDSIMNSAIPLRKDTRLWAFWRLPPIRMFLSSAGGQVDIFFVLSGFVLTWSSFGHIESQNFSRLYSSLGSSAFRRWSRLFLPCVVVTYLYVLQQDLNEDKNIFVGLWQYMGEALDWINPFQQVSDGTSGFQIHNGVVWTIPYEFSGSIYIFVMVLILGRLQFSRRVFVSTLITFGAFLANKWHLWLFGSGMILADFARHYQLLKRDRNRRTNIWRSMLWAGVFVLGLICAGWPKPFPNVYTRPGYDWFNNIPLPKGFEGPGKLFQGLGAIFMIGSACHLWIVRRFYETALMQYLGKLSFMLYLIHILVGGQVGRKILHSSYNRLCVYDDEKVSGIAVCHINPVLHSVLLVGVYAINIVCVFIVANILERLVDRPITNLGKVVDDLLLHTWHSKEPSPPSAEQEERRLLDSISLDEMERGEAEAKDFSSDDSSFKDSISESSSSSGSRLRSGS